MDQPRKSFFESVHTEPHEGVQDVPPVDWPYPETYEKSGDDSLTEEDDEPGPQYDFLAAANDLAEHIKRDVRAMKRDLRQRFQAVMSYYNLIRKATTKSTKKAKTRTVAESMNKRPNYGINIMVWANLWLSERTIPETRRGTTNKVPVLVGG